MLTDGGEPSCYKEAILANDHAKWERAMQSELDSIHKNEYLGFGTFAKRYESITMQVGLQV